MTLLILNTISKSIADSSYDCYSETSVSGIIQDKKNFLKDSDYFSAYNIFKFNEDFTLLSEQEKKIDGKLSYNNYFRCVKKIGKDIVSCVPVSSINKYIIYFSTKTLRFKKKLITNFWLNGIGEEIDYIHLSQGSCNLI